MGVGWGGGEWEGLNEQLGAGSHGSSRLSANTYPHTNPAGKLVVPDGQEVRLPPGTQNHDRGCAQGSTLSPTALCTAIVQLQVVPGGSTSHLGRAPLSCKLLLSTTCFHYGTRIRADMGQSTPAWLAPPCLQTYAQGIRDIPRHLAPVRQYGAIEATRLR
jgi:hypothetical protein